MPYKEKLRRDKNIQSNYTIEDKKPSEVRTNNPYTDIEAYFYNIFDENNNLINSYEVEVVISTSSASETLHIKEI